MTHSTPSRKSRRTEESAGGMRDYLAILLVGAGGGGRGRSGASRGGSRGRRTSRAFRAEPSTCPAGSFWFTPSWPGSTWPGCAGGSPLVAGIVCAVALAGRRLAGPASRRRRRRTRSRRAAAPRLGGIRRRRSGRVLRRARGVRAHRLPRLRLPLGHQGPPLLPAGARSTTTFSAAEWNLVAHRDYPQLVPELYALQSMIAGRFSEPALLVWSAVWFAALLIAACEALDAWNVRQDWARWVFVVLTLAIGVFAVGHLMAGSVDWIIAFALTAALPALVRPALRSRRDPARRARGAGRVDQARRHPARRDS